ncbi:DUF58 domain-containing protein [Actinoallomurus rhizosphaericola]|uniref:DUF58 domain-containing protein n=1 Tax=Actinoallomurus rhizosphaericola TaxID=2952536 RepID=UPI002093DAAD|nr:DUF58 domain-containing protein [Actinoallomurus rhizosphaericola]MCO5995349.1 DUF58 domain-containing protein [Actinoallomurus rhizosphaericola]
MPTRLGAAMLTAGLCCLIGGHLLGYPRLDVLGCAALIAVAAAWAAVTWRPSLALSRDLHPAHVTRGETAVCVLTVRNTGRLPAPRTIVHDRLGDHRLPLELPFLRPGATTTITYRLDTTRRGVFDAGPLRWERRDTLGLAAAARTTGDVRRVHVHPATHPMAIVPSGRVRNPEGPVADTVLAGGATFHRLREYVPGDDLRQVHWRSSARAGTLMVRENVDTSLPATTLLLDVHPDAYDDAAFFEEAVEVAASALVAAVRLRFPARCVAGDTTIDARGGVRDVLDRLAALTAAAGPRLPHLADTLPHRRTGTALIAVTGRIDAADLAALRRVAPSHDRTALVVLRGDPAAAGTPDGGAAIMPGDGGTGPSVIAASSAAEACARWNALIGAGR